MQVIKVRDTIGWHITSKDFSNQFQDALDTGEDIELHINSPGGSVYQGWEMFNEVRMAISRGAEVRTYNMGLAASMGSVMFLSAKPDNRFMAKNSLYMIHNPKGFAFGEKEDMKKEIEMLGKVEDLLSNLYAEETDTDQEYMKTLMGRTTWYKPKEAKSEGFFSKIVDGADEVENVKVVGMAKTAFAGMPSNCLPDLSFSDERSNIDTEDSFADLTKISNSQIREKTWMNYLKS